MTPTQLLPMRPACADDAGSWCSRFYELTRAGGTQLETATDAWRRLTVVVGHVLDLG